MQVEVLEDRQLLATITVNATADDTTADATLSLREAIEVSDGTLAVSSLSTQEQVQVSGTVGATNTIDFNIPITDPGYNPATGVWTIAPHSPLPAISTNAAIIDGYTQPGASENTLAQGDNAKLTIAIDGSGAGFIVRPGLTIGQSGSQVSGLDIEDFEDSAILITPDGNVQVAGCFIGTDPSGEAIALNGDGVEVESSSNTIGGPNVGDRNVISGNSYAGVNIGNPHGLVPTGNVIENNFIGTDATGTKVLGNQTEGVEDTGAGNTCGGTAAGSGNVISGNADYGIYATGSVTIEGNYVGTDVTGNVALGNGSGGSGIEATGAANTAVSVTITNNVVSGNATDGIILAPGSQGQLSGMVANNRIGTNAAGTATLGNAYQGLVMSSVENCEVLNNIISGNQVGVYLSGSSADLAHNVFQGNLIGTDKTGLVNLGNMSGGISLISAIGDTIGGTGPGQGNVIAFNGGDGIYFGLGSQEDPITQNSIFGNAGLGINPYLAGYSIASFSALTFTPGGGSSGTLAGTFSRHAKPGVRRRDLLEPDGPGVRPGTGQDVRPGCDGEYRRLGQGHLLGDRTDRLLLGNDNRPDRKYLAVLGRHGITAAAGFGDDGVVVIEPFDGRPAGDLDLCRYGARVSGDPDRNGDVHDRRSGAVLRDALRRRGRGRSAVHDLDAHGGVALGHGSV